MSTAPVLPQLPQAQDRSQPGFYTKMMLPEMECSQTSHTSPNWRTIEKLAKDLRAKKRRRVTLEAFPSLHAETDRARERYERLRNLYLHGTVDPADPDAGHFSRRGLAGLFDPGPLLGYWVEVHEARVRVWGRVDPRDAALREAMRLLLTPGHLADHSSSSIAERRIAL